MSPNGQQRQVPGIPLLIPPDVVPTQYEVTPVEGRDQDGKVVHLVRETMWTPTGVHITFWEAIAAQQRGKRLLEAGRQAQVGLTIVGDLGIQENGDGPKLP